MKRFTNCMLGLCFAVVAVLLPMRGFAQTSIVIEGGTLIDGNGGAPVPDSVVIIQGNKIAAVSRKGQATYPANAQVIKADGKFILPGLIDAQVSYSWPFGEAMLINGVTSTIDIGNGGEVAVAHRDGVTLGRIRGPRTFTSIAHINGVPEPRWSTGFESALTPAHVPKIRRGNPGNGEETHRHGRGLHQFPGRQSSARLLQGGRRRSAQSRKGRADALLRAARVSEGCRRIGNCRNHALGRDCFCGRQGKAHEGPRRRRRTRSVRRDG